METTKKTHTQAKKSKASPKWQAWWLGGPHCCCRRCHQGAGAMIEHRFISPWMDCDEVISHVAEIRMQGVALLGKDVVEVVGSS